VTAPWPVGVHPAGLVAAGTVLWRYQHALQCTVIVKASWIFDRHGRVQRSAAEPVHREYGDGPGERRSSSSDLAPYLPAGEFWLEGNPRAGRVQLLHGARSVDTTRSPSETLFDRRLDAGPMGLTPAGERRPSFTSEQRARLARQPIELDDTFSWEPFHAVAVAQRIPLLSGGERVVLDGLVEGAPSLVTFVPAAAARAYVYAGSTPLTVVAMSIDGLAVDVHACRMTVRWRGGVALGSRAPADVSVLVGVETASETLDWSEAASAVAPTSSRAPFSSRAGVSAAAPSDVPPPTSVAPAAAALPSSTILVVPSAASPSAKRSPSLDHTVSLGDSVARDAGSSLPFQQASGPPASAPPPPSFPTPEQRAVDIPGAPWARAQEPVIPPSARTGAGAPARSGADRSSQVPIVNTTAMRVEAFPWRVSDRQVLVVVAKASCDIEPGGRAKIRDAVAPLSGDKAFPPRIVGRALSQERSLSYPSDFAVFKKRADVVLVGHGYAPGGHGEAALATFRFGSARGGFERRVAVFGKRTWVKTLLDSTPSRPEHFSCVPLVYERAFGGAGYADNPVGVGFYPQGAIRQGDSLPNLEDPDALITRPGDRPEPACFGPRHKHWGVGYPGSQNEPWDCDFPESFDWSSFQIAPPGQQLDRIEGDERFECTALHVKHARLEAWLPGLRLRAFADYTEDFGGGFRELPMKLDTVLIEPDDLQLTMVWRHTIDVSDARAPEIRALFVASEEMALPPEPLVVARQRYQRLVGS
jgi:hypothetical protein